jgi:hypothetical protein
MNMYRNILVESLYQSGVYKQEQYVMRIIEEQNPSQCNIWTLTMMILIKTILKLF